MRAFSLLSLTALLFASVAVPAAETKGAKVLIITGDDVPVHKWKETSPFLKKLLTKAGLTVDITETASKDLTPENLARYDAFVLNYRDTPKGAKDNPASVWSEANKKAFLDAVKGGKGLYVHHYSSGAFTTPSAIDKEFEKAIAGGWRKQGYHGKMHRFTVTVRKEHPITDGVKEFEHGRDELYQNSMMLPGSEVLVTAYSEKAKDPKNTGKHEPVVWVAKYGKGRVVENVLGHDLEAMKDPVYQALLIRGVEWAATGKATYPAPASPKGGK